MVNEASGFGTGQLPDKEGQMYHITEDNLYLIPTAEVPITNIFRDVIVDASDFPIRYTGYTPCFRRSFGSYGKTSRTQSLTPVWQSGNSTNTTPKIVIKPQRYGSVRVPTIRRARTTIPILKLCGGDTIPALTLDMEAFSAAQERWLEVFHLQLCYRQLIKIKVQRLNKRAFQPYPNGSALALPRILKHYLKIIKTKRVFLFPLLQPYCFKRIELWKHTYLSYQPFWWLVLIPKWMPKNRQSINYRANTTAHSSNKSHWHSIGKRQSKKYKEAIKLAGEKIDAAKPKGNQNFLNNLKLTRRPFAT